MLILICTAKIKVNLVKGLRPLLSHVGSATALPKTKGRLRGVVVAWGVGDIAERCSYILLMLRWLRWMVKRTHPNVRPYFLGGFWLVEEWG